MITFNSNWKASSILVLFFLLFTQFLWFPYLLALFIFSNEDIAISYGFLFRVIFIVLFYFIFKYRVGIENIGSWSVDTIHFKYKDMTLFGLAYFSINQLVFWLLSYISVPFPPPETYTYDWAFGVDSLYAVFFAPVVEEILHRWLFLLVFAQISFKKEDMKMKAVINAALFSLIHWDSRYMYIIDYPGFLSSVFAWAAFGLLAFYVYYHTRKLALVIWLHISTNFFYIFFRVLIVGEFLEENVHDSLMMGFPVAGIVLVLIYYRRSLHQFFMEFFKDLSDHGIKYSLTFIGTILFIGTITLVIYAIATLNAITASIMFFLGMSTYIWLLVYVSRSQENDSPVEV